MLSIKCLELANMDAERGYIALIHPAEGQVTARLMTGTRLAVPGLGWFWSVSFLMQARPAARRKPSYSSRSSLPRS